MRGTRVPVALIVNFVETGHTPAEIIDADPQLTDADITVAVAYARAEEARTEIREW